jgi:hypothetical protein
MKKLLSVLMMSGLLVGSLYAAEPEPAQKSPSPDTPGFQESRFKLRLQNWIVEFEGETSLIKKISGDRIDLGAKLDLEDEFSPQITGRWQFKPRHALEVSYTYLDSDGSADISEGVVIDDVAIPGLGHVEADTELHFLRLDWRRKLFMPSSGKYEAETIVGILGFDIDAEYAAHLPGAGWVGNVPDPLRELYHEVLGEILPDELDFLNTAVYWDDDFHLTAGTYLLGGAGTWRPHRKWNLNAEVTGAWAGDYGWFVDCEAGVGYRPVDWFEVFAGYRYWHTEVEDDDDEYEIIFSGIFAGIELSF